MILNLQADDVASYNQARTEQVVFRTNDRLLVFSGDDHLDWLQGQLTQNLLPARPGDSTAFAIASATGQIQGYGRLYWGERDTTVIADVTSAYALQERVQRFVILEDVELAMPNVRVWSAQGPLASDLPADGWWHDRFGLGGFDFALPIEGEHHTSLTPLAQDLLRMESGWPVMGIDTTEKTLVAELGEWFVGQTVHYEKGCYTGQEILMRIYSRGHVNRSRVGLLLEDPIENLADITDPDGQVCGSTQQVAVSPRLGPIATGLLRTEAMGKQLWVGKAKARAVALPFPESR
ncbi:MAG: hypothetical protein JNJ45_06340 [Chthonomonas sp.]|nr:hypothetical protein [Chthonomonas sp.]